MTVHTRHNGRRHTEQLLQQMAAAIHLLANPRMREAVAASAGLMDAVSGPGNSVSRAPSTSSDS